MRQQGFQTDEALCAWYEAQGITDIDGLYERHQVHVASISEVESIVGSENSYVFGALSEVERKALIESSEFDLIVSLGGDDTAKDISRYVARKPLLILNSDEIGSIGALASHTRPQFRQLFENLQGGNYLVEEWPRLEAIIKTADDGMIITSPPALNEIEIGDMYTKWPFRGVLEQEGKEPTSVKGNGLLISVPAGLTGWFTSETEGIYPLGHSRPRTDMVAEIAVRARYRYGETEFHNLSDSGEQVATRPGLLKAGEELVVRSTSNHTATINVDSAWECRFPRGSEATIRMSESPLVVISKQKPSE
jgi:NAD kinase